MLWIVRETPLRTISNPLNIDHADIALRIAIATVMPRNGESTVKGGQAGVVGTTTARTDLLVRRLRTACKADNANNDQRKQLLSHGGADATQ